MMIATLLFVFGAAAKDCSETMLVKDLQPGTEIIGKKFFPIRQSKRSPVAKLHKEDERVYFEFLGGSAIDLGTQNGQTKGLLRGSVFVTAKRANFQWPAGVFMKTYCTLKSVTPLDQNLNPFGSKSIVAFSGLALLMEDSTVCGLVELVAHRATLDPRETHLMTVGNLLDTMGRNYFSIKPKCK